MVKEPSKATCKSNIPSSIGVVTLVASAIILAYWVLAPPESLPSKSIWPAKSPLAGDAEFL